MKNIMLLGLVIIGCVTAVSCFAQGSSEPTGGNDAGQSKTIFSFKNEIGLTDEQENKLKALLYDDQNLSNSYRNNLNILSQELIRMVNNKEDLKIIKRKLEEISKIQVEVSCRSIEIQRKIESILSPAQYKKWENIKANEPSKK